MPKEQNNTSNIVHLEGPVDKCLTRDLDGGALLALIELSTASARKTAEGNRSFSNVMFHRIEVLTRNEEKANELRRIAQELRQEGADHPFLSVKGGLSVNSNGQVFVLADDRTGELKLVDKKDASFKNTVNISGKILQTSSNNAYAVATLAVANAMEGMPDVRIPVCIYHNDNPKQWTELSGGKIQKGQTMSVRGPLITRPYSDGEKTKSICSVNIKKYEILDQIKKETKKSTMSV